MISKIPLWLKILLIVIATVIFGSVVFLILGRVFGFISSVFMWIFKALNWFGI